MLSEEQQLELALKASLGNNSMLDLANDMDEDDVVEIFPEISKDPKTGSIIWKNVKQCSFQ
jgi:hypothetical protein